MSAEQTRRDVRAAPDDARGLAPRILHVVDSLELGGLEIALANVLEHTKEQFHHSVCCIRGIGTVGHRLREAGIPVHLIGKANGRDWTVAFRIARLCRVIRPHVVHTRNWGAIEGVIGARLARVPAVIHSEHGRDVPSSHSGQRGRTLARRLLAPWIDRIVTVSADMQRRLREEIRGRPEKVVVVRNGVDRDRFTPSANRHALRCAQGYDPADVLIGAVGRLHRVKGHAGLLEAFRLLSLHHPNARLVLVGDGPERSPLQRSVETMGLRGVVRLVGHCDNVQEWLAMTDVFVQPSLMEGISNAVLEAMATALPVVATRVGGNPEVVVDGVTGRLVPADDAATMCEGIASYCTDAAARARHGAAGRARVQQSYTVSTMLAAYAALYRSLR